MRNIYKNEQSGRSMVEMLGVLAIIGVLSVGGISGYSKAMAKFKTSKAMDQLSLLIANIRTAYSTVANYTGLNNGTAKQYMIASTDMYGDNPSTMTSAAKLVNAFGGSLFITSTINQTIADTGFAITYNGLGKEACVTLATADWGTGGLAALQVNGAGQSKPTTNPTTAVAPAAGVGTYLISSLPVSLANAYLSCGSKEAVNSITWYFY